MGRGGAEHAVFIAGISKRLSDTKKDVKSLHHDIAYLTYNNTFYYSLEYNIFFNLVFAVTGSDITVNVLNSSKDIMYSFPVQIGTDDLTLGYEYMIISKGEFDIAQVTKTGTSSDEESPQQSLTYIIPDKVLCIMALKRDEIYIKEIMLLDEKYNQLLLEYGLRLFI